MKWLLLIGAVMGFAIGLGFGMIHHKSLAMSLLQACVALYVGARLMRWWGRKWEAALRESQGDARRG